jgi:hypothetical protein
MNGFLNNPAFRVIGKNQNQLESDLIYASDSGELYVVPANFVTDWASIPRVFWLVCSPLDEARLAGTLHDWLYSLKGEAPYNLSRKECDDLFKEALKYDIPPSPYWRRVVMWACLRIFGSFAWKNKKIFI